MLRKNKPQNRSTFCMNVTPGVKCCEMRKEKRGPEREKKWHEIPCYRLFVFRILQSFSRILR